MRRSRLDRRFVLRLAAILVAGAVCIAAAALYRQSLRPKAVPADVQRQGLELVETILARVGDTQFGRSERGRLLAETIRDFARRGRLVFTAELDTQALYRREADGYEALYVKVLRLSGKPVHQSPQWVAEGLFHEAVHARSPRNAMSIDEECDGFAAGLAAGALIDGSDVPDLLTIEGRPVADFVRRAYPDLPRNPAYQPVGQSREWLKATTGLRSPAED